VTDLTSTLVEEKARAKYTHGKKVFDEGGSSTILVQKKNPHASHNNKKNKPIFNPKVAMTFEKKGKGKDNCFLCGSYENWAKECLDHRDKQKKIANMVINESRGPRYGNYLPTILSVCLSPEWWVDTCANIHLCADISLFSSYHDGRGSSLVMGNESHVVVHGVGTVNLKFISGKIV
jgi:hypothetical protein